MGFLSQGGGITLPITKERKMNINLGEAECMLIIISLSRIHFELTSEKKEYQIRQEILKKIQDAYSEHENPKDLPLHANNLATKLVEHRSKCRREIAKIMGKQ